MYEYTKINAEKMEVWKTSAVYIVWRCRQDKSRSITLIVSTFSVLRNAHTVVKNLNAGSEVLFAPVHDSSLLFPCSLGSNRHLASAPPVWGVGGSSHLSTALGKKKTPCMDLNTSKRLPSAGHIRWRRRGRRGCCTCCGSCRRIFQTDG